MEPERRPDHALLKEAGARIPRHTKIFSLPYTHIVLKDGLLALLLTTQSITYIDYLVLLHILLSMAPWVAVNATLLHT